MKIPNLLPVLLVFFSCFAQGATPKKIILEAEAAASRPDRVEVVERATFKDGKGAALKTGVLASTDTVQLAADITFQVTPEQPGRYEIITNAAVNDVGRTLIAKAKTKYDSLFMMIAVGDEPAVRRVLFVPWGDADGTLSTIGKFDLKAGSQPIRIWLPAGVQLDYISISPYVPPAVPDAVAGYQPTIVPPATHPRLWVNAESLPRVRANLTQGENAAIWKKLQKEAAKPFVFHDVPGHRSDSNPQLETAAVNKAFVYLMSGDKQMGRQAIGLMDDYLSAVEFGNLLDITREIGRAIYAGARVYDWCYDLMTPQERDSLRQNMMRLADDMEIGWPPFKQIVVNGHGSEGQLFCHLLSMAIAIYSEDTKPYQYCAYRILEELVPMRKFEYQSPRHNQGFGYGIYRFTWDMHAAWLLYRMSGQKVFDHNFENVHKYWLNTRLPDGTNFPDGDGNAEGRKTNLGLLSLMSSAYSGDPYMKYDFMRQGGFPSDPLMVLFLNDPTLVPTKDFTGMPLTFNFGPILGGMVARTGWNMDEKSSDAVVFMTGGGYNFDNHQHADAGSFQVYYHGMQVADLGQYMFYGTPYDNNFNKRSIAHSMMLAYDPNEKFNSDEQLNDGGTRVGFSSPKSVREVTSNPKYANGTVLSADFGPSLETPDYSYFSVDLTSAYSDKMRNYIRSFCFLNLNDPQTPAALIIVDHMETSGSQVKKYWQINTFNKPRQIAGGLLLTASDKTTTGNVRLKMLQPRPEDLTMEIHSGTDSTNVFGHQLTAPKPDDVQAKGHRIMFSPVKSQSMDEFLTVLTMSENSETSLPMNLDFSGDAYILRIANRIVVLSKSGSPLTSTISLTIPAGPDKQVILTGLHPGPWTIQNGNGTDNRDLEIAEKKNTASITLPPGAYQIKSR